MAGGCCGHEAEAAADVDVGHVGHVQVDVARPADPWYFGSYGHRGGHASCKYATIKFPLRHLKTLENSHAEPFSN